MRVSKISIVITTINETRIIAIKKCISELISQLVRFPHNKMINVEFILVIEENYKAFNMLKNITRDIISTYPDIVRGNVVFKLIFSDKKLGLSGARNIGIANSTGDIIAFLDDDVVPSKLWLKTIINSFEKNPSLVCAGGPVIPIVVLHKKHAFLLRYIVPWLFGSHPPHMWSYEGEVPFLIGSNMFFRRKIFDMIGLFDTRLGFAYRSKRGIRSLVGGEETELILRIHLMKSNSRIYMYRAAYVGHIVDLRRINPFVILKRAFFFGFSTEMIYKHFLKKFGKSALDKIATKHIEYHVVNWKKILRSIMKVQARKRKIYGLLSFFIISIFLIVGKILSKFFSDICSS